MASLRSDLWRPCFVAAGVLISAGGMQHPQGSMAEMLTHPDWVMSHTLVLVGFLSLLAGLVLYRGAVTLPARSARWLRFALAGTVLQVVEMVFHTVSVVDGEHLAAGHSTPILSTHLVLAVILYPIFGATTIGFIVATARDRALGSPWIAWLGVLGAVAHGAAPPLVVGLEIAQARILFPMLLFLALWLVLAALWPLRAAARPAPAPA